MEYTKLANSLDLMGYTMLDPGAKKEPADWLAVIVNVDEDDVIEVNCKTKFVKQTLAYFDVSQEAWNINNFNRQKGDPVRAVLWGFYA